MNLRWGYDWILPSSRISIARWLLAEVPIDGWFFFESETPGSPFGPVGPMSPFCPGFPWGPSNPIGPGGPKNGLFYVRRWKYPPGGDQGREKYMQWIHESVLTFSQKFIGGHTLKLVVTTYKSCDWLILASIQFTGIPEYLIWNFYFSKIYFRASDTRCYICHIVTLVTT